MFERRSNESVGNENSMNYYESLVLYRFLISSNKWSNFDLSRAERKLTNRECYTHHSFIHSFIHWFTHFVQFIICNIIRKFKRAKWKKKIEPNRTINDELLSTHLRNQCSIAVQHWIVSQQNHHFYHLNDALVFYHRLTWSSWHAICDVKQHLKF